MVVVMVCVCMGRSDESPLLSPMLLMGHINIDKFCRAIPWNVIIR